MINKNQNKKSKSNTKHKKTQGKSKYLTSSIKSSFSATISMHFQLHPFPHVLRSLYRKDKDSFPPFQQGVHRLPEL